VKRSSSGIPPWNDEELAAFAADARAIFVERYRTKVRAEFERIESACQEEVEELFEATQMLHALTTEPDFLAARPELVHIARYLTKPVISKDTLRIVGEQEGVTDTILACLDRDRLPWLIQGRRVKRTDSEVTAAIAVTARLMAEQRAATAQRVVASRAQERLVRNALEHAGLTFVETKEIRARLRALGDEVKKGVTRTNYQEALRRGEFTREIAISGAKCDVPVRLPSGELLPVECKVSNSEVNSVKRLNRETGGKHERWRTSFGSELRTVAVVGGVFALPSLRSAQDDGILIVFDHAIEGLEALVGA
jgi:XamI restriction endonuclease